jgi:ParB/RepB/Spo0J family partition protein
MALHCIDIPKERLRALRPGDVDTLAESMKRVGLLHPITVRSRPGRGYWIVAGAHRFLAAEKLRWKEIECVVLDGCSADDAELIEIDENLIRAELTPAETAMHIGKRKEIYERVHGSAKANGARAAHKVMGRGDANDKLSDAFTTDTAKKTGKHERAIQRDAARAQSVKVLPDIINTSLDKGTELDALAKLPVEQQRKLAARAKNGEQVSARKQRPATEIDSRAESAIEELIELGFVDEQTEEVNKEGRRVLALFRHAKFI